MSQTKTIQQEEVSSDEDKNMDMNKDKNIDKVGDENTDEGEDENMDNDEDENIDNNKETSMFTFILFNTISKHFFQSIEVHKQYKLVLI